MGHPDSFWSSILTLERIRWIPNCILWKPLPTMITRIGFKRSPTSTLIPELEKLVSILLCDLCAKCWSSKCSRQVHLCVVGCFLWDTLLLWGQKRSLPFVQRCSSKDRGSNLVWKVLWQLRLSWAELHISFFMSITLVRHTIRDALPAHLQNLRFFLEKMRCFSCLRISTTIGIICDCYLANFNVVCLILLRTILSQFASIKPGKN